MVASRRSCSNPDRFATDAGAISSRARRSLNHQYKAPSLDRAFSSEPRLTRRTCPPRIRAEIVVNAEADDVGRNVDVDANAKSRVVSPVAQVNMKVFGWSVPDLEGEARAERGLSSVLRVCCGRGRMSLALETASHEADHDTPVGHG